MVIKNRDSVIESVRKILGDIEDSIRNNSLIMDLRVLDKERCYIRLEFIDSGLQKDIEYINENIRNSTLSKYEVEFFEYFNRVLISEVKKIPIMEKFRNDSGFVVNTSVNRGDFVCLDDKGNPVCSDLVRDGIYNRFLWKFFWKNWGGIYSDFLKDICVDCNSYKKFIDESLSKKLQDDRKNGNFWLSEVRGCEKKLLIQDQSWCKFFR